jgi:predicted Zn-dependent peptidase
MSSSRSCPIKKIKRPSGSILYGVLASLVFLLGFDVTASKEQPEKSALGNGLPVIYQRDNSSPLSVLQVFIDGGKGAQPPGLEGLAYLTARLTIEIPDENKVQDLMSQSSRTVLVCREDYSYITISCFSGNFEKTVGIVAGIMRDPLFSGLRIDRIKRFMGHFRDREQDDSINIGRLENLRAFFGTSGVGSSIYGNEDALKAIKKKDISDFYDRHFTAAHMTLAVASDLERTKVLEVLQKNFGKFPPQSKNSETLPSSSPGQMPELREKEKFIEKEMKQTFVSMSFLLPGLSGKNYVLACLAENLLGRNIGSRLWLLRAQERLAYNVNARATLMKNGGLLEAYLETDAEKTAAAKEALTNVLKELYDQGIDGEELAATKTSTKANFLRADETKEARTRNLASFEVLGLGHEFSLRFPEEIDKVSLDELNSFIREFLAPPKAYLVVVGRKN